MRRLTGAILGIVLLLVTALPALAARPEAGCPAESSGFSLVDQQEWWDITVAGFETEGIEVYVGGDPGNGFTAEFDEFAAGFGFGDGQGLYDFVWITQWQKLDKNDDLLLCLKLRPNTPGNPAYFVTGVDNTAS